MSEKYIIFGATGSIGSSLAEKLASDKAEIHLVARNQDEVKPLAERLGCTYTVADVLQDGFIEKVKTDVTEAKGIAYCIGSIDLKPVRMTKEDDFNKCMKLNLYSAVEAIKGFQDSLRKNKGSIVLFSTAAVHRGFTNHSIISSGDDGYGRPRVALINDNYPVVIFRNNSIPKTIKIARWNGIDFDSAYDITK